MASNSGAGRRSASAMVHDVSQAEPAPGSREYKRARAKIRRQNARDETSPNIGRLIGAGFSNGATSIHIRVGHAPCFVSTNGKGKPKLRAFSKRVLQDANCSQGGLNSSDALAMFKAVTPTSTMRELSSIVGKGPRDQRKAVSTFSMAYGEQGICLVRAIATPKKRGLDIALVPINGVLDSLP